MQPLSVTNILTRMILKGEFVQICEKIGNRLFNRDIDEISVENLAHLEATAENISIFLEALDSKLFIETTEEAELIGVNATATLNTIEYDLGGGGAYDLLYFLIRYLKPSVILETGVAAGFSSYALLLGIKTNGTGTLFSSDFPYFRIPNPEQYIGVIVPSFLKKNWKLFIEGDRNNLPVICSQVGEIDLFHYDSDKSYRGREFALSCVAKKLSDKAVVIMDDIQNNNFFFDYIRKHSIENVRIFEFEGKYLGMWWHEASKLNHEV